MTRTMARARAKCHDAWGGEQIGGSASVGDRSRCVVETNDYFLEKTRHLARADISAARAAHDRAQGDV